MHFDMLFLKPFMALYNMNTYVRSYICSENMYSIATSKRSHVSAAVATRTRKLIYIAIYNNYTYSAGMKDVGMDVGFPC